MSARADPSSLQTTDVEATLAALRDVRSRTLALVAPISDADLERVHSPLMSPLVWDLGHIAAYEDLWLGHRHAGHELLRPELADCYDAFETPRAVRGEIEMLARTPALQYLDQVSGRTAADAAAAGVGDGELHEMVIRHEHQHNETMLQTLELARLPGYRPAGASPVAAQAAPAAGGDDGLQTVKVVAGPFQLGAAPTRFSYDNERPRHTLQLAAFEIGRTPVTNGAWLAFVQGGGYTQREWWSDEGWAWRSEHDVARPGGWSEDLREWRLGAWEPLHPDRPVVHVSWFEADAFARAHGVRLPTEAEWEKAAAWDPRSGRTLDWPWGEEPPTRERANLFEFGALGTAPVGAHSAGTAPCGATGMLGDVWEWTSSPFGGYPAFVAHPYREYSEVFFGEHYRVLRGGSWATSTRVANATFRNWDLPQRRQIFAGVRIARSA